MKARKKHDFHEKGMHQPCCTLLLIESPQYCSIRFRKIEVPHSSLELVESFSYNIRVQTTVLYLFQVEMLSWGYLFQRAYTLQINLGPLVSRVPTASHQHTGNESATSNFNEEIRLTGRIMLNIWRLMRHEVFQSYTYCNTSNFCVWH